MRQFTAMLTAAAMLFSGLGITAQAQGVSYPEDFTAYQNLVESHPDGYRNDGNSVYFFELERNAATMELVVAGQQAADVTRNTYGYIFTPEADGVYTVGERLRCEEIVSFDVDGQDTHFHYFYTKLHMFTVTVENGTASVTKKGGYSLRSQTKIDETIEAVRADHENADTEPVLGCFDVYSEEEFPNETFCYCAAVDLQTEAFVTACYNEWGSAESWLCLLIDKRKGKDFLEVDAAQGEVLAPYEYEQTLKPEIAQNDLYCIKPLQDGTMTVTAGTVQYLAEVQDGIVQGFTKKKTPCPGDLKGDWRVDVFAVYALQQSIAGDSDAIIDPENADLNGDGGIDVFDLAVLKRMAFQYELTNAAGSWTQLAFLMDGAAQSEKVFTAMDTALIVLAVPAVEMQDPTYMDENGYILGGCEVWWEPMEHFEAKTDAANCEIVQSGTEAFDGNGYFSCLVQMTGEGTAEIVCQSERRRVTVMLTADANGNILSAEIGSAEK